MSDITWSMNKQQQEKELRRRVLEELPRSVVWETCGMSFKRDFTKDEWERIGKLNEWNKK